jgi:hypothetical protein
LLEILANERIRRNHRIGRRRVGSGRRFRRALRRDGVDDHLFGLLAGAERRERAEEKQGTKLG